MQIEFYTVNSKLTLKNNTIWEKNLIQQKPSYWLHSVVLLIALLILTVYEALAGEFYKWFLSIMIIVWLTPHITRLYRLLFVKVWRWYIPLREIKVINLHQDYNELEEKVTVVLNSGREKIFIFRKMEHQAEKFVYQINSQKENNLPATQRDFGVA